jgi:hypothetical protein
MPYGNGFNLPSDIYGGSGFNGRIQTGGRINNVFGYDNNNNPLTTTNQYNQYQQSQQPATGFQQQGGGNPMDFFSRMAGMGGLGMGSSSGSVNWNNPKYRSGTVTQNFNAYQNDLQAWNKAHSYTGYGPPPAPTIWDKVEEGKQRAMAAGWNPNAPSTIRANSMIDYGLGGYRR